MRCAIRTFKTSNFQPITGVGYLKLSDETWNEMCYLKLLKLFNPSQELVIWNFQMRLEKEVLFETFEIWNFSNPWWGLLIWNFQMRLEMRCAIRTFKTSNFNPSQELVIWNFQMRLEMRCAIWNIWNLKLYKHVMVAAYLKLSDETWNEMCYLKLLKFETFQTHDGGCLFETFRWDLKWDVLLELLKLETFQPIIGVGYLKLSDKTWNEMCYLKLLKLFNLFKPITRAAYLKLSD